MKSSKNGRKYNIVVGAGVLGFVLVGLIVFFISDITDGILKLTGQLFTFLGTITGTYLAANTVTKHKSFDDK